MRTPYSPPSPIAHRGTERPAFLVVSVVNTSEGNSLLPAVSNGVHNRAEHERIEAAHRSPELSEAAHRSIVTRSPLTAGAGGQDALGCFGTFVETKHEGNQSCNAQQRDVRKSSSGDTREDFSTSPLDITIIDRQAEEMYFTKEEPKMADHSHPMDGALLDLSITRMRLVDLFSRDGEICADERAALDLFDDAKRTVSDLHNLDRAVETYKKQYRHGITRYGQRRWNLAGLAVEPYDPDAA